MTLTKSAPVYEKKRFSWDRFVHEAEHYLHIAAHDYGEAHRLARPTFVAPSHLARPSVPFDRVTFLFTDEQLDEIVRDPSQYKKDLNAALTYGYIGHSNGGRNGIALLRGTDKRMQHRVDEYLKASHIPDDGMFMPPRDVLAEEYGIGRLLQGETQPHHLEGVKIVCHRKNGLRTIGVRDANTNHILFFDRMTYTA